MIPWRKDTTASFERELFKLHSVLKYICPVKILIVRFSSIGDIVLTTPVVRALGTHFPDAEIHYLTKDKFRSIVAPNPHLNKVWTIQKSIDEVLAALKEERFDYIIDLHHNVRTLSLKKKLGVRAYSFPKLNWKKWMLVKLKRNSMPDKHVVDRYFEAVEPLGVKADGNPGEFFIPAADEIDMISEFGWEPGSYLAVAIGAQFTTKRMPEDLLVQILLEVTMPIVLLGGPEDAEMANEIQSELKDHQLVHACGKWNLAQSASVVKQSAKVLTNDTGMMHIAACFDRPIVSVWGNTVPAFGMYPYYPKAKEKFSIHEVQGLSCRPCSKIGHASCPKGHFDCMNKQDVEAIASRLKD